MKQNGSFSKGRAIWYSTPLKHCSSFYIMLVNIGFFWAMKCIMLKYRHVTSFWLYLKDPSWYCSASSAMSLINCNCSVSFVVIDSMSRSCCCENNMALSGQLRTELHRMPLGCTTLEAFGTLIVSLWWEPLLSIFSFLTALFGLLMTSACLIRLPTLSLPFLFSIKFP